MFEKFTEKAIKVIMLAQEESRRLGHNYVGTEFILLGLILEGTASAAKTLKTAGVNLKEARLEVENSAGRGSGFTAVEIPFTPKAKRLLEMSWQESKRLGHNYIGPQHLLIGLLQAGDDDHAGDEAVKVLSNLGVSTAKLKADIVAEAQKDPPSPPTKAGPGPSRTIQLSAEDTVDVALEKALESVRHAKAISIRAQEFELAAWLRDKETELVEKVQKRPRTL